MVCASLWEFFSYVNSKSLMMRRREFRNEQVLGLASEDSLLAQQKTWRTYFDLQISNVTLDNEFHWLGWDQCLLNTTMSEKPSGEAIENALIMSVQYFDCRIFCCCAARIANVTSSWTTCYSSKICCFFLKDEQMQCTVNLCVRTHALKDNKHPAMAASWLTFRVEDVKLAQVEC